MGEAEVAQQTLEVLKSIDAKLWWLVFLTVLVILFN